MNANPQNADGVQRVVLAGMKLMYSPQVFPMFSEALQKDPSPQGIARQTAGLMKILRDKSNGTMPQQIMIPAAVALLFEMVGFMVQAGAPKPSEADMRQAAQVLVKLMVQVFGGAQGAPAAPAGLGVAPAAQQQPAPAGLIGG